VPAPAWFTARLPEPLDGELWLGRLRFDELSGLVRKDVPVDAQWRQMRYMVFELPGAEGAFEACARRIAEIAGQTAWAQLVAVEHTPVADRADLRHRLATTLARGGRRPGAVPGLGRVPHRPHRRDAQAQAQPRHRSYRLRTPAGPG
jgi:DNA ligase-1